MHTLLLAFIFRVLERLIKKKKNVYFSFLLLFSTYPFFMKQKADGFFLSYF